MLDVSPPILFGFFVWGFVKSKKIFVYVDGGINAHSINYAPALFWIRASDDEHQKRKTPKQSVV